MIALVRGRGQPLFVLIAKWYGGRQPPFGTSSSLTRTNGLCAMGNCQ